MNELKIGVITEQIIIDLLVDLLVDSTRVRHCRTSHEQLVRNPSNYQKPLAFSENKREAVTVRFAQRNSLRCSPQTTDFFILGTFCRRFAGRKRLLQTSSLAFLFIFSPFFIARVYSGRTKPVVVALVASPVLLCAPARDGLESSKCVLPEGAAQQ